MYVTVFKSNTYDWSVIHSLLLLHLSQVLTLASTVGITQAADGADGVPQEYYNTRLNNGDEATGAEADH